MPGSSEYVACGRHAVEAFLRARPRDVRRVLVGREPAVGVLAAARAAGVEPEPVDAAELDRVAGGLTHQGVVALGRWPAPVDLKTIAARAPDVLLALDGVTDPRNAGALVRTAECLGVGGLVLQRDRVVGASPALVRAAAGAFEWLPLVRVTNLTRALQDLRDAGYWIIGLSGDAAMDLDEPDAVPGLPAVLVLGAEDQGLRRLVAESCHRLLRIPMRGRTESLNVSAAGAIGLYRIVALRDGAKTRP